MMRLACMVLVATGLLFGSREAAAQTCTASAPDLYFGNLQSPANATVDVAAPMTVSCDGGSAYANQTLRVCIGIDPAGWLSGRTMYPGGNGIFSPSIDYEVFVDSGRTQPWDSNPQHEVLVVLNGSGIGTGTRMMYARMAPPGGRAAGSYSSGLTDDVFEGRIKNGNSGCGSNNSTGNFVGQPFDVSVYINGGCEITVTPLLDFGTVSGAITTPVDSSISLQAECSSQLPYTVALGDGLHASGAQRRMRSAGGEVVDYGLFQDVARSQRWGDGTPEPVRQGTGSGGQQTLTIYGRVPAGQTVPSGTYKDTVTATITY